MRCNKGFHTFHFFKTFNSCPLSQKVSQGCAPPKQGSKPRNRKICCLRVKSGIPSGCSGDTEQTCQKDGIDKTPVEPKDSLKGCFFSVVIFPKWMWKLSKWKKPPGKARSYARDKKVSFFVFVFVFLSLSCKCYLQGCNGANTEGGANWLSFNCWECGGGREAESYIFAFPNGKSTDCD